MFLSQDTIFPSGSVTLVSIVLSGKKLPGNPKLPKVSTYMVARLRTEKLAQCLLPILLIQEEPFEKFAIMQS